MKTEWTKVGVKNDNKDVYPKDFDAGEVLTGIQWGVEALRAEKPGGADVDTIFSVIEGLAEISGKLFDLRNKLRVAKGLEPLTLENCREGINDVAGYQDKDRAVLFLAAMAGEVRNAPAQEMVLAIVAGWLPSRAKAAIQQGIDIGLVKKTMVKTNDALIAKRVGK